VVPCDPERPVVPSDPDAIVVPSDPDERVVFSDPDEPVVASVLASGVPRIRENRFLQCACGGVGFGFKYQVLEWTRSTGGYLSLILKKNRFSFDS
jgi:hypothetical protein